MDKGPDCERGLVSSRPGCYKSSASSTSCPPGYTLLSAALCHSGFSSMPSLGVAPQCGPPRLRDPMLSNSFAVIIHSAWNFVMAAESKLRLWPMGLYSKILVNSSRQGHYLVDSVRLQGPLEAEKGKEMVLPGSFWKNTALLRLSGC